MNIKNHSSIWTKIGLAVLSGLLLTCSFPKLGWDWLTWVALIPLLFSLKGVTPFTGFRLGLLSGLIHQMTLIYWMAYTMTQFGQLPWAVSVPVMGLLACYLALYPAIFSLLISRFLQKPLAAVILMPFLWVALEYGRSVIFTGFPWELLGYSQYRNLRLIQMADTLGVYGISFLIVLVNAVLFFSMHAVIRREDRPVTKSAALAGLASGVMFLAIFWVYGDYRIQQTDAFRSVAPTSRIAVVQGNIDQGIKWDPKFQDATVQKYIDLSQQAKTDSPDLIVWPETATPFYFLYDEPQTRMVQDGIRQVKTDFLIGTPYFTLKDRIIRFFNSAFLITSNGSVSEKYHKAHLVPFGEYVPLKKFLPFIGKMVEQVGDFEAGEKGALIPWQNARLGVLICYEAIFPDLSRKTVKNGSTVLINITNDAWYGRTSAPYQHFSMAVFRAVENRRALVRSANTGFSGFIDPVGRIGNHTELFEDAVLTENVPLLSTLSFYTRFGDVFALGCIAVSLILSAFGFRRTKQQA